MNLFQRILRYFVLLLRKTAHSGQFILTDPISKYKIDPGTRFRLIQNGTMCMGAFRCEPNVHFTAKGGKLEIGAGCFFNRNDIVICREHIQIGRNTVFGPNVCVYDHDHAFGANGKIDGKYHTAPVQIGENVWIGAGTIILRGSRIGDNCVIGAGCVISGTIPPNSLVKPTRELTVTALEDRSKDLCTKESRE